MSTITVTATTVTARARVSKFSNTTVQPTSSTDAFFFAISGAATKGKALVSFAQISSDVSYNCNINFPGLFQSLLESLAIFKLDIIPSLGLGCYFNSFDYINKMVVVTLMPFALLGLLLFVFALKGCSGGTSSLTEKDLEKVYPTPIEFVDVISSAKLNRLRKVAKFFDAIGGGTITRAEMAITVRELEPTFSEEKIKEKVDLYFMEAGCVGSSDISFDAILKIDRSSQRGQSTEFGNLIVDLEKRVSKGSWTSFFNFFLLLTFMVLTNVSCTLFNYFKVDPLSAIIF